MGLLNKIKNALFEEEVVEEPVVAKQIELPKEEKPVINYYEEELEEQPKRSFAKEKEEAPIIFDVEDFIEEEKVEEVYEEPKKEEKILYGGYEVKNHDKIEEKDKFRPSPIISPVYGIIHNEPPKEERTNYEKKSLDRLFVDEKKPQLDFDTVRQKAYGYNNVKKEPVESEKSLLYEMKEDDAPGIERISIGDAEEYFEDLGLEYNVDYTDLAKEKMTRSKKNKDLTEIINEEIKEDNKIAREKFSTNNLYKKEPEEKEERNLYDLIDMMYEGK